MAAKFYQTPWSAPIQLLPADTTVLKTVATITAPTRINQIIVTSTDTGAKDIQLVATIGGADYILGTFAIPLRSGDTNAAPTVMLLKSTQWGLELNNDIGNNKVLDIIGSVGTPVTLKVKAGSSVTAAKAINILFSGAQDVA